MTDSGRGVGLTSQPNRRVTRSASKEAAAARTQTSRASQQQQRTQPQPQPRTMPKKQPHQPYEDEEDDQDEQHDGEVDDIEHNDNDDDDDDEDDDSAPCSPEYEEVKSAHLNEPLLSKAKRVYEYINRQHYSDIQRAQQQQQAAQTAIEAEQQQQTATSDPKFYSLLFQDRANRSTLYTLLVVSAVMLCAPLLTFFGVSAVLSGLGWSDKWRLSVSGGCAVVVVNVVSIGFGLYAYWEAEDEETEEEREAREGRTRADQDNWVRHVTKGQMVGVGKWNEELKQERDEAQQGGRKKVR